MKRRAETPATSSNLKLSRSEDGKYGHTDQRMMVLSSSDSSYVTISDSESDSKDSENEVIIIPDLEDDVLPVIPNGHCRPIIFTPLPQGENPFVQHAKGHTGNNTGFSQSHSLKNCIDVDHHQQRPDIQSSDLQLDTIDQSLADCSSLQNTNTSPMNLCKSSTDVTSLPFGTADELFQSAEIVLNLMQQDLDTLNSATSLDEMEKVKKGKKSRKKNDYIFLNALKTQKRKKLHKKIRRIETTLNYLKKQANKLTSSVSTTSLDADSKERFEQMCQNYYSEKSHLLKQLSVVALQIESAHENLSKSQDKPLHQNICNQQIAIFLRTKKQLENSLRDTETSFQSAFGNFSDVFEIDAFCDLKTISETVRSWRSARPDKSLEDKKHKQMVTLKKRCNDKLTDIDKLAKARKVQKQLDQSYFMLKPLAQILLCRQQKRKALRVSQQKEVICNGLQTCQQPWKFISQCMPTVAYSAGISSVCQFGADQWQVLHKGAGFEPAVQKHGSLSASGHLCLASPHTCTLTPNESFVQMPTGVISDGPGAPEFGDGRDAKQMYDRRICHFVADLADSLKITQEQRVNAKYTSTMNGIRNMIRNFIIKYKQKQLNKQM